MKTKLTPARELPEIYMLIIRATRHGGNLEDRDDCIRHLHHSRGGWLTDDQIAEAGLTPAEYNEIVAARPHSS